MLHNLLRAVKKFWQLKTFTLRKDIQLISLQQMFEVVAMMLDTKFHPFNPLLNSGVIRRTLRGEGDAPCKITM
jgi:hypothetical protein